MHVIGLISGTSMDAIDAAAIDVARTDGRLSLTLRAFVSAPYPSRVRNELEKIVGDVAAQSKSTSVADLGALNVEIGHAFADAALLAQKESEIRPDLIGSHGQTIAHHPSAGQNGQLGFSVQLGEPAVIAMRTGVTTVADFRVADVAGEGQGAPLVPYVDYELLSSPTEDRVALNIGGIANITVLPAGCSKADVTAFDTGPGNMPIDIAVRQLFPGGQDYDRNGQIAARGTTCTPLLAQLRDDAYYRRSAPKSAGSEQFGKAFVDRAWQQAQQLSCNAEGFVATLTELTAATIAEAIPTTCRRVIVSGGGVHNKTLMSVLAKHLNITADGAALEISDRFGLPADAKEAIAFGVLAFDALHGQATNLPRATGARHPVILGKIVPGANYCDLMRSIWA